MGVLFATMAVGIASISIIPKPLSLTPHPGAFLLNDKTTIVAPGELDRLGRQVQAELSPSTGFKLPVLRRGGTNSIRLRLSRSLANLGPEGYSLEVNEDGVEIQSAAQAGVFYGIQSLRQLFPVDNYRRALVSGVQWSVPCVSIQDKPRFSWRGLHIDVGRHFMPKEFLLKYIDLIAMHKMNVLHLHLTEDQGWRIEIKKYPKLTEIGSRRKESQVGRYNEHRFDGTPEGGFYTQDDIREIVAYAKDRFVNVMPEIEMPGHSQAAIAAYPELGNTGQQLEVRTGWGVSENVYNVNDSTIHFVEDVLDEVLKLFPSKFIHVGGDEVPKTQWHASTEAQARMKDLGLKDERELQSWFMHQIDQYLTAKGRRMVGWDEILEGGLAPGATVMSWRGEEGGIAAAKAGHDVIMTPSGSTYLDHSQSRNVKAEPVNIGGYLPLQNVYAYEPVPNGLTPEEARHVLGAQGQIWTEYIATTQLLEYMVFPRACALAEVLWTPANEKNYPDFLQRLDTHLKRLKILDVHYRPLAGPDPAGEGH